MSHSPPSPPPGDEFPPEEILLGRGAAWILTSLFLLLLAVPPLLDGLPGRVREFAAAVAGKGSSKPIAERLRGYDNSVAAASFTDAPRRLTQQVLTGFLNKGNDRVVIGKDGWLFYRPEIQALTGYGPLDPEPHSVSRDPALLDWEAPLEPIIEFGRQLQDRGVALWLVPVPMKPSIYPEKLTGEPASHDKHGYVRHRDAARFFSAMEKGGHLKVVDLAPLLFEAKTRDQLASGEPSPLYLTMDTHWSMRGMKLVAGHLAASVKAEPWWTKPDGPAWPMEKSPVWPTYGDLHEKLGLLERVPRSRSQVEPSLQTEELLTVHPPEGISVTGDRRSPIVLLGDSFVNIFDDPSLGFSRIDLKKRSQSGLAWHLAAGLGVGLDVHSVNGEGASGVRRWLAQRGESVVRSKKLVIWVIAERDLFLSRSVAKANRVSWDRMTIAPDPPAAPAGSAIPAGPAVVEAELIEKSDQADPRRANYENSLYTVQYRILKNLSGPPVSGVVEVVHWSFKKRVLQPTAAIEPGKVYRLNLEPWAAQSELTPINREVLGEAAPGWFGATAEPVP